MNSASISSNNTRLLDLLLKATRTSNENLRPHHTNIKKTIQVLAQVLDKDNLSVLHYIAYYNNLYICRKLADENCDFNTVGNNGETILHIAVRSKIINEDTQSLLIYLLSKLLVNINKHDNQGRTALQSHKTSFHIYSKIDYLNAKTRDGHDAFSFARTNTAYAGQSKCFEYVLNAILNRHTFVHDLLIDRYGRTLLHLSVLSRQINIQIDSFLFVQFIEPMIYTLDYNDETPLHLAVRFSLYDICALLLQSSDKLDAIQNPYIYLDKIDGELIRSIGYKNKNGQSSFHTAILYGHIYIMNYLLEYTDANFSTPLHCVAQCVNIKCSNGIDACIPLLDIFLKYIQNFFSTIPFAWFKSAFMVLDTGYEDRFFGLDSGKYISLYPVIFVIFLLFGIAITTLVNNLLTALAVGEIANLSAIARMRNATRRYKLLREWEIFRLQYLWTPATLYLRHEYIEDKWNRQLYICLKWIYRHTFLEANN
ncbi:unnamed protein product [Adineta steineri]|uniref:Uncharacterized protein n=1 Tax=Adineta steineri TaxID=433720 RepID=A0A814BAS9_9BILA|nr:unnamed protein product [Adineta steineri]CAF1106295.1 unnamed protein product [Adineta steineri]CAF1208983.1 unnamed protein product [Adineta steineri]